jgi:hypothetical protein
MAEQISIMDGTPRETFVLKADSNNVFTIPADKIKVDGEVATGAWISCETYGCRIAFGGATPSNVTPLGHVLNAGDSLFLRQAMWLRTAKIINKTAGENFVLQITMEE